MKTQLRNKFAFMALIICEFTMLNAQHYEFYGTATGGEFNHGAIYKMDKNGDNLNIIYSFPVTIEGSNPQGNLCIAKNGKYYGTTRFGGSNNLGVLYEWDPSNNSYTVKHRFNQTNYGDGTCGSLILAKNNKLYGMIKWGGSLYTNVGIIYEWDPETDTYTEKYNFRDSTGSSPNGSLMQADNGKLYGMTIAGGTYSEGVLFEWDPGTNVYTRKFDFNGNFGKYPNGALIQANNGKLYGMTSGGGLFNCGVLFEWDISSDTCIKKFDFNSENGRNPNGSLTMASNGMLYGVTENGGNQGSGVLFEWDPNTSTFVKKYDFGQEKDGRNPRGTLVQSDNGNLYGLTGSGGTEDRGILFEWDPSTNTYHKKLDFGTFENGEMPNSIVLRNSNMLLGIASDGGTGDGGTLFEWDINAESFTKRVDFNECPNGCSPGFLILADKVRLYGANGSGGKYGHGVLFKWDIPTNTFTKITDIGDKETNSGSIGALLLEDNGRLIGMTQESSDNTRVLYEWDIVNDSLLKKRKLLSKEDETIRTGPLVQANNGKIYGVCQGGSSEYGVLFKLNPSSDSLIKMIDFNGPDRGSYPYGPLTPGDDGKFYGITYMGGINNSGVIFKWDANTETYTKMYDRNGPEYNRPMGYLAKAVNGKFYGIDNQNQIFEWDNTTNVYSVKIKDRDLSGATSLMQSVNGKFYGTIYDQGNFGVFFEWNPLTNNLRTNKLPYGFHPYDQLLEIEYTPPGTLYADACDSYTSPSGKYTWNSSGTYTDTIPRSNGTDSIITVNLTVRHKTNSTINVTECKRYLSPGGKLWTSSGVYYDTIPNARECDSVITVNLTIQCNEFYGYAAKDSTAGTIYKTNAHGDNFTTVYSFIPENMGIYPQGNLCAALNGKFYGVTSDGGIHDGGVIFEWDTSGNIYKVKYSFTNYSGEGGRPNGLLVNAANGKIYGTTSNGGETGNGVLFEYDPATGAYSKKLDFKTWNHSSNPTPGYLITDQKGKFYVMAYLKEPYDSCVLFKFDPETATYDNKFNINDLSINGISSFGSLVQATDGKLYGKIREDFYYGHEVLFNWDTTENHYTKLYDLVVQNGDNGSLIQASNGKIYGVDLSGIFEWDIETKTFTHKYTIEDGNMRSGTLIQADNGKLYGTSYTEMFEWDPVTNIFLRKFTYDGINTGSQPTGSFILIDKDKLVGLTQEGGSDGSGILYEWDSNSEIFTKKIDFNYCENGRNPTGSLIQVNNDKLFGTTAGGGKYGDGVLFEWDIPTHTFIKKADFNMQQTGKYPSGLLVQSDNGKLIGVTRLYMSSPKIFEWNPSDSTLLGKYDFCLDGNDSCGISNNNVVVPAGSLVKTETGRIFGISLQSWHNSGGLFEWDPLVSTFTMKSDGTFSYFPLIAAHDGKLYGNNSSIFSWDPNTNIVTRKIDYFDYSYCFELSSPLLEYNEKFYGILSDVRCEGDGGLFYEWDTTTNIITKKTWHAALTRNSEYDSPLLKSGNGKIYGTSHNGLFEWDPANDVLLTKPTNGSKPYGGLIEIKCLTYSTIYVKACNSFISPDGKQLWVKSGSYLDTIPGIRGCDSVINVNLTIVSPDTSIMIEEGVIRSNASDAAYQWISCADGNSPLEGETHQTFTASADGDYAVIVSQNGCIDTSACLAVSVTGLAVNTLKHGITLYPNPTDGSFTIDLGTSYPKAEITITQLDGRIIKKDFIINGRFRDLKLAGSPGPYMVTIIADDEKAMFKIVKK